MDHIFILLMPPLSSECAKVCLGPKRPRQVISFEDRIRVDDDQMAPKLSIFEHFEGSKVGCSSQRRQDGAWHCLDGNRFAYLRMSYPFQPIYFITHDSSQVGKELFPAYQLPNGKMMYMYYNGGQLLDEVRTGF